MTSVAELELDLDVFAGPFDLLLAMRPPRGDRLLEVRARGDRDRLRRSPRGGRVELDLEAVDRVPRPDRGPAASSSRGCCCRMRTDAELELGPEEAADELLARMLEYRRYKRGRRGCSASCFEGRALSCIARRRRRRSCGGRARGLAQAYEPDRLGVALGDLLALPPEVDTQPHPQHRLARSAVSSVLRDLLGSQQDARLRRGVRPRGSLHPGGDAVRAARAVPPGEATWTQKETFGRIEVEKRQ